MTKEIEQYLKLEMQNKVYAHVWVTTLLSQTLTINNDLYLVRDGEVFHINKNRELDKSGDSLFEVNTRCICLGDYYHEVGHRSTSIEIQYEDFMKTLKF